jgi:uncharacterized damage-inducible protein DinB
MISDGVRYYLLLGLEGAPTVFTHLLNKTSKSSWDQRPDTERYTLREVAAHMADWDGVWLERLEKMRVQNNPTIQGYDPDDFLKRNNYAQIEVPVSIKRFQEGRTKLYKIFEGLELAQWSRTGQHTERGPISIHDLAQMVVGHDVYHLKQIAEWIEKTK